MLPNGSIGHKNSLPWKGQKYKEIARRDMEHFKNVTEGKSVVMGYNTFESLNFKPLKNRLNHLLLLPEIYLLICLIMLLKLIYAIL